MAFFGRTARNTVSVVLVLGCTFAVVTACGSDDETTSTTASDDTVGNVVAPVIADLGTIDGTTVEVAVGGTIDLTGDDTTYTDWSASIVDPGVVEFTAGSDDGGASFNPGLAALVPGSTEVTMENSTSGASVTFTVDVTP